MILSRLFPCLVAVLIMAVLAIALIIIVVDRLHEEWDAAASILLQHFGG